MYRTFFNRFNNQFNRLFSSQVKGSTEGTIEKTIIKNSTENGYSIFEKINLVERFSKLSPWARRSLMIYGALAAGGFTIATYNDGRTELMDYYKNPSMYGGHKSEWDAAKKGCKKNVWSNFVQSVFFPYTAVSNVMPYIVIGTTPKKQ